MTHVRVSEILAQFRDLSKINKKVLDDKGLIGTEVHTNIYEYNNDGIWAHDLFPIRSHDGHILPDKEGNQRWEKRGKGYFESYKKWHATNKPIFNMMEQRFYCDDLMLTGQMDALRIQDNKLVLMDWKCSYKEDLEMWAMQAHYYKYLLEINGIQIADHFLWMKLDKDAKDPKVFQMPYEKSVMDRCLKEAILFWEKKGDARDVA